MAAYLSSAEDICEGENCEAITDVTYYVKEKKKLCEDCASKGGCIGKARKGGFNPYCVKHDEEIKLYCKTHGVALCYRCAHIDHQQPCVKQDIKGAIMENKAKLNDLKEKAKDKLKLCRVYGEQIRQCRKDTDTHLQALTDEVETVINEAIKTDKGKEIEVAAKINQEIDKKIKKLQDEMGWRLYVIWTDGEIRRRPIEDKHHGLQKDIKEITEEKEKKIVELEKAWQDDTRTTENTIQELDTVLQDDTKIVKDWYRVTTSVSDKLKKPLNKGNVEQITGKIYGVRFMKGVWEKYDGMIVGYDEWELGEKIGVCMIVCVMVTVYLGIAFRYTN